MGEINTLTSIIGNPTLNKYFKKRPTKNFVINKLLPCYNLYSFDDNTEINRDSSHNIIRNLTNLVPEICEFVQNSSLKKGFIYNKVTFYKTIILLKNFLNCFNMTIKRRKINYKKTTKIYYSIISINDDLLLDYSCESFFLYCKKKPIVTIDDSTTFKINKIPIVIDFSN